MNATTKKQLEMFKEPHSGDRVVAWNVLERNEKVYTPEEALAYIEQYEPGARNLNVIPCNVLFLENSNFFLVGFTEQELEDSGFTIEEGGEDDKT